MNQFRFANIEWLHAMWIVLGLGLLLVALELRGGRILERLLSPLMLSRLVRRPSLTRRLWSLLLLCASLSFLVLALMRPQWGSTVQLQTRVDSQIMICLDVSRSMLAEDVVPNRLERAQAEIDSLLSLMRDGQQVGLLAFAGKASVLCPLTTDFGFLRMILAEANPATVGLGGTRIGEAITKAVDGFRDVGDVNRLILLITDGEDHDSFPLDAAQAAQEKGIRIVSIGFGDELGSKIEITDPRTGGRSYVEDRDGTAVISRLDGETLREIALATEGAYIPAGTGALDWQSIYSAHIAGFLRGSAAEEETVVRNEAYQWCVLGALLLLLGALASPTLFTQDRDMDHLLLTARASASRAAVCLACGLYLVSNPTDLQTVAAQTTSPTPSEEEQVQPTGNPSTTDNPAAVTNASPKLSTEDEELSDDPRELYNRAVTYVMSDPERAERLLNASRRAAGVDGELRFRALYNLGWVEIQRADQLLEQEPAQALKHLELAAGRFREAIRVRPESDDARHNLELISRRILELSDSLAEHDSRQFAERLDELIKRMREHQSELQEMCGLVSAAGTNEESLRLEFRQLGVVQRQIISDFEKLSADARRQASATQSQTAAQSNAQSNATAEQAIEAAQLTAMLAYADNAVQRMHKSRSFIRRLQAERAFVRWAASLTDAKRARDQLRDPLEILGVLIADATEQLQLIRLMQWTSGQTPVDGPAAIQKPSWLSTEVVSDGQLATTERTDELVRLLSAGLKQVQSPPASVSPTEPSPQQVPQEFIAQLEAALPIINRASQHFAQAQQSISSQDWQLTLEQQTSGIAALMEAAEVFYDIRRLIDATLADQRGISAELASSSETAALEQVAVSSAQDKNLTRIERLAEMFKQQLDKIDSANAEGSDKTAAEPAQQTPDEEANNVTAEKAAAEQAAAEKERFELAEQLRRAAEQSMHRMFTELNKPIPSESAEVPPAPPELERPPAPRPRPATSAQAPSVAADAAIPLATDSDSAVASLEELQRLFFSVIEHLKQTAERQTELNDHTTELLAQPDQNTAARVGSLQLRQQTLERTSQEIANALAEQAASMQAEATAAEEPTTSTDAAEPDALSEPEKFLQAAELVRAGAQAMSTAQTALADTATANTPEVADAPPSEPQPTSQALQRVSQDQLAALLKLQEALTLLEPPPSENQNQQQPQQQPQERSEEKTESNPQNMDAEQMLQAIREREANRRRERQPQSSAAAGVEKDW
jgi:Ca-activated chloride channel family protein